MTFSVLAGLLARQPFRPFSFVIAGDRVFVGRASQVRLDAGARIVTVIRDDGWEYHIDLDRVDMIAIDPR